MDKMNYDELPPIDKVSIDIMECLRNCNLRPDEALNVLLSISVSIAEELLEQTRTHFNPTPKEQIEFISNRISDIQFFQKSQDES